ncbi:catalase-related domain-containing protein [Streptomyces pratensis]|uniref:catalase-related domain-containing protein n=1 Tax=Streptomyces pratensis TaxID=1169025 RepID=UPI0037899DA3
MAPPTGPLDERASGRGCGAPRAPGIGPAAASRPGRRSGPHRPEPLFQARERLPDVAFHEAPASFDGHFSQARPFWLSMKPVECDHIIATYTFELRKCYEQGIKERALVVLARFDAQLCGEVAAGLGLPVPVVGEVLPEPTLQAMPRRGAAS